MTTPASPSPGTQLLSEEELELAFASVRFGRKYEAEIAIAKLDGHIKALDRQRAGNIPAPPEPLNNADIERALAFLEHHERAHFSRADSKATASVRSHIAALTAENARLTEEASWKCQANPKAVEPQDCDWPNCGCDPHAQRVCEGLLESGWIGPREAAALTASRNAAHVAWCTLADVREPHWRGAGAPEYGDWLLQAILQDARESEAEIEEMREARDQAVGLLRALDLYEDFSEPIEAEVPQYYDDPTEVNAVRERIHTLLATLSQQPEAQGK